MQDEERAHWREHGSGRALIDAARAGDEGLATEPFGVYEPVIGIVWLAKHRKPRRLGHPVKPPRIDDRSAHRGAMSAHELGQGVYDDIGAVFDRPQEDRRGHGVVDDQRQPARVRDISERLDVADVAGRIADGFTKDGACGLVD